MRYLDIYLNDHLAGAVAGVELARRAARAQRREPQGPALERLRRDVEQDRDDLRRVLHRLGVRVDPVKPRLAWVGEKLGRLKLNGRVLRRSPLSSLVEVEVLRLGVQGKQELWRALLAAGLPELDQADLQRLAARAEAQGAALAGLHDQVAAGVLRTR